MTDVRAGPAASLLSALHRWRKEWTAALEKDRARATAEYLAEFRSDLEAYIDIAVVEGCVGGHREMLAAAGTFYSAFCDPASGSGQDSFTCAVAHKKSDGEIIIDALREVRFFSPSAVIGDLASLLKGYRIWQISGDPFAGEFPRELFRQHGISYEVCKSPKSDLYLGDQVHHDIELAGISKEVSDTGNGQHQLKYQA